MVLDVTQEDAGFACYGCALIRVSEHSSRVEGTPAAHQDQGIALAHADLIRDAHAVVRGLQLVIRPAHQNLHTSTHDGASEPDWPAAPVVSLPPVIAHVLAGVG